MRPWCDSQSVWIGEVDLVPHFQGSHHVHDDASGVFHGAWKGLLPHGHGRLNFVLRRDRYKTLDEQLQEELVAAQKKAAKEAKAEAMKEETNPLLSMVDGPALHAHGGAGATAGGSAASSTAVITANGSLVKPPGVADADGDSKLVEANGQDTEHESAIGGGGREAEACQVRPHLKLVLVLVVVLLLLLLLLLSCTGTVWSIVVCVAFRFLCLILTQAFVWLERQRHGMCNGLLYDQAVGTFDQGKLGGYVTLWYNNGAEYEGPFVEECPRCALLAEDKDGDSPRLGIIQKRDKR